MTSSPSTSDSSSASCSNDSMLDSAVEDLEKMMLNSRSSSETSLDKAKEIETPDEKNPKPISTKPIESKSNSKWRLNSRKLWKSAPYQIPRRKAAPTSNSTNNPAAVLQKIKWKGDDDVDYLKYTLLDDRRETIACSMQAARPLSPDFELDELAEYFGHFVRLESKLSSLAESMYC